MSTSEVRATAAAPPVPGQRIVLDAVCILRGAPSLKSALLEALGSHAAVEIDAAAVEQIDTAALQLLVACVRECAARATPVRFSAASAEFDRAVAQLGLGAALGLDTHQRGSTS